MVVEIWLVYFSCTKADYVSEIPVVSGIPVQDVNGVVQQYNQRQSCGLYNFHFVREATYSSYLDPLELYIA